MLFEHLVQVFDDAQVAMEDGGPHRALEKLDRDVGPERRRRTNQARHEVTSYYRDSL